MRFLSAFAASSSRGTSCRGPPRRHAQSATLGRRPDRSPLPPAQRGAARSRQQLLHVPSTATVRRPERGGHVDLDPSVGRIGRRHAGTRAPCPYPRSFDTTLPARRGSAEGADGLDQHVPADADGVDLDVLLGAVEAGSGRSRAADPADSGAAAAFDASFDQPTPRPPPLALAASPGRPRLAEGARAVQGAGSGTDASHQARQIHPPRGGAVPLPRRVAGLLRILRGPLCPAPPRTSGPGAGFAAVAWTYWKRGRTRFKPLADWDWNWPTRLRPPRLERILTLDFLAAARTSSSSEPSDSARPCSPGTSPTRPSSPDTPALFTTAADLLLDLNGQEAARASNDASATT